MPDTTSPTPSSPAPLASTRTRLALLVLAWALAAGPLWSQMLRIGYDRSTPPAVVAILLAAMLVVFRLPNPIGITVAVVAGIGGSRLVDSFIGPSAFLTIICLSSAWCLATGAIVPRSIAARAQLLHGALFPLLVADALLVSRYGFKWPMVAIVVAAASIVVTVLRTMPIRPNDDDRLERAPKLRRFARANARVMSAVGRPIGVVLGAIGMVPAFVILTVTWFGQRLFRIDPLRAPTAPSSRWVVRTGPDGVPSHAYPDAPVHDPGRRARGALAVAAAFLPVLLIAAGVWFVQRPDDTTTEEITRPEVVDEPEAVDCDDFEGEDDVDPVMDGQPGWPALQCENGEFIQRPTFDAATVFSYQDFESTNLNETDGVRAGWTPPACDCRRLRVWWLGGSAAWGAFQRDEHTLPSQIARVAHEQGVTLDITNYALPAWVLGQESARVGQLTTTEPPPDLVIFYDGGNELTRQDFRNDVGRGDDESPTSAAEQEIAQLLLAGPFGEPRPEPTVPSDRKLPPERVATAAMNRYTRDVDLARRITESVGATPVFVWQPLAPDAPASARRAEAVTTVLRDRYHRMAPVVERLLPDEVIDLSDSLDAVDRPVFRDLWHTNEYGARVVAEALVDRLLPDFRRLAAAPSDEVDR